MLKNIVLRIISIITSLYPSRLNNHLSHWRDVIHTQWIKHYIGQVGEHSQIGIGVEVQRGGNKSIYIGNHCWIGKHTVLGCWEYYGSPKYYPVISIGDKTSIGEYCHISAAQEVIIGNGVLTGRFVYISDNNHGNTDYETLQQRPSERKLHVKGPVRIGDNVWIGDKVSILSGVTVGEGSIIACNAVVTHDVPPYSVAAGVPAKVIKTIKNK